MSHRGIFPELRDENMRSPFDEILKKIKKKKLTPTQQANWMGANRDLRFPGSTVDRDAKDVILFWAYALPYPGGDFKESIPVGVFAPPRFLGVKSYLVLTETGREIKRVLKWKKAIIAVPFDIYDDYLFEENNPSEPFGKSRIISLWRRNSLSGFESGDFYQKIIESKGKIGPSLECDYLISISNSDLVS